MLWRRPDRSTSTSKRHLEASHYRAVSRRLLPGRFGRPASTTGEGLEASRTSNDRSHTITDICKRCEGIIHESAILFGHICSFFLPSMRSAFIKRRRLFRAADPHPSQKCVSHTPIPNDNISDRCCPIPSGLTHHLAQSRLSRRLLVTWCLSKKCGAKIISLRLQVVEILLDDARKPISLELGLLVDNGSHSRGNGWLEGVVDVVDNGLSIGVGDRTGSLGIACG